MRKGAPSPPSDLALQIFIAKPKRLKKNNLTRNILLILLTTFILFIFCSIVNVQVDYNGQKLVINWNLKTRQEHNAPNSTNEEAQQKECPTVICPTSPLFLPECPELPAPPTCPPVRLCPTLKPQPDYTPWNRPTQGVEDSKQAGNTVTFYTDSFYAGGSYNVTLEGDKCSDLPYGFDVYISSMKTYGKCVVLWMKPGCQGARKRVFTNQPGTPFGYASFDQLTYGASYSSSINNC